MRQPDSPTFSIGTFNVKNLALPGAEYYRFEAYTPEEHAWKVDWLSDQLLAMDADIVAFQEIFDAAALREIVDIANRKAEEGNRASVPGKDRPYWRRAVFRKLYFAPYETPAVHVPNLNDGEPGERRPGLGVVSRFPFIEPPTAIQDLTHDPISVDLSGTDAPYALTRLSRPILRARIMAHGRPLTVFSVHLKSKLPEFHRPEGADFAPEADLEHADLLARAAGSLRATIRRAAEALALRREILRELETGVPVIALGDFNDGAQSTTLESIMGERPFRNYAWLRRHDAKRGDERYSPAQDAAIRARLKAARMHSAEAIFARRSLRDVMYTSTFGGVYESIDQILLSHHFDPDDGAAIGALDYLRVHNDHLSDDAHPEAPHNKLASDHGQLVATLRWRDGRGAAA